MNGTHFETMRKHPKIFMGMSDTTVNHFMCLKAGLSSFYSPALMFGYAENGGIPDYIVKNTEKSLFSTEPIGTLMPSKDFIVQKIPFDDFQTIRCRISAESWRFIQGSTKASGRLIGAQGILSKLSGILFARPGGEFSAQKVEKQNQYIAHYTDYDVAILKVLREYNCTEIPVVTNMDFGHTVPQLILPYGALCEIDVCTRKVSILEAGVV